MSALGSADESAPADLSKAAGRGLDRRDLPPNGDRLTRSRERVRRVLSGGKPSAEPSGAPTLASPDHAMLRMAQVAARRALETLADRHPLPLVGMAIAAGGLLVWMRPWRGFLRPALVAGIAARLIARVPAKNALAFVTTILGPSHPRGSERRNTAR